jgi:hypothetical protein
VALCQARISTKPLWGFSSSNPYHSQSRAEQVGTTQLQNGRRDNIYASDKLHLAPKGKEKKMRQ